ncbi:MULTISPECIES: hypothetical protein [unclassified Sporolactobacillus]|uniref:hypothetical protein n=1 Tax=unclassified Sporolactobacillus TaxID=2628533 RepID=UPI002367BEB2|nr:hypothetical protein [Sporolactobacillus sp. CQH2019]MDD9149664.1 hypothetical protein [Sporolactobacillus sp. CQH2019]
MKRIRVSFILALVGILFDMIFVDMTYWKTGMLWFWVGVFLSYACSITAIVLTFLKYKENISDLDFALQLLSFIFSTFNLFGTTLAVMAEFWGF